MLFVRKALKNLLIVHTLGGVAHVNYFCMPATAVFCGARFVRARTQGSGGKCSPQPCRGWRLERLLERLTSL